MAPFIGFGWGWGDPGTWTGSKIDFLKEGQHFIALQREVNHSKTFGESMPPDFQIIGKMMYMQHLDVQGVQGLLAIGFRLTDDNSENWTSRFNQFKARHQGAVEAGARTLAEAIRSIRLSEANRVVVVGAISSGDRHLAETAPVRRLGEAIAEAKGWEWKPEILVKEPHQRLHDIRSAGDRDREVRGAYTAERVDGEPGAFVIVDDFCTRGSTFGDISRALIAANEGWHTWGVALAKTERSAFWGGDISNEHVCADLTNAWRENT